MTSAEAVDKADRDREGDEVNELAPTHEAERDLKHARENDGRE